MAISVGVVTADFIARDAGFGDGLRRMGRDADRFQERLRSMQRSLVGLATGVSFAAIGRELVNLVQTVNKAQLDIGRFAQTLGETPKSFALVVDAVSKDIGFEAEKTFQIIRDIQEKVGEALRVGATGRSEAGEALATLNINLEEFARLDPVKQLAELGRALDDIESRQVRVAVLEQLASDLSNLLPLFDDNNARFAELVRLAETRGKFVDQGDVEDAENLKEAYDRLADRFSTLKQSVIDNLRTPITNLLTIVDELISQIDVAVSRLRNLVGGIPDWVKTAVLEGAKALPVVGSLVGAGVTLAGGSGGVAGAYPDYINRALQEEGLPIPVPVQPVVDESAAQVFADQVRATGAAIEGQGGTGDKSGRSGLRATADVLEDNTRVFREELREQERYLSELGRAYDALEQDLIGLAEAGLGGSPVFSEMSDELQQLDIDMERTRENIAVLKENLGTAESELGIRADAVAARVERLQESAKVPTELAQQAEALIAAYFPVERAQEEFDKLKDLIDRIRAVDTGGAPLLTEEQASGIIKKAGKDLERFSAGFSDVEYAAQSAGAAIAGAMGQAITNFQNADQVGKQLLNTLANIVAQAAFEPLGDAIGDGINLFLDSLPFFGGAADGQVISGGSLGQGVLTGPTLFPINSPGFHTFAKGTALAGEAGYEAIMPLERTAGGKLGVNASAMAPNVNVEVRPMPGQTAEVEQLDERLLVRIVRATTSDDVRRGGSAISRSIEGTYAGMRRGR